VSDLRPGTYNAYVTEAYLGKSRNKGTPQLEIRFQLEGDSAPFIWAYRYFTDNGWQYLEKELKAMGWDPRAHDYDFEKLDTKKDNDGRIVRHSALAENPCWVQIVVQDETYTDDQGVSRTSTKVRFINEIRVREEMPEQEKKTFLTDLRKRMIAASGQSHNAGRQPGSPPRPRTPQGSATPANEGGQSSPERTHKERVQDAVADSLKDAGIDAGDGGFEEIPF